MKNISLKTTNINRIISLEEKFKDHKKVNTVLVRSLQALIMGMTVVLIWSF